VSDFCTKRTYIFLIRIGIFVMTMNFIGIFFSYFWPRRVFTAIIMRLFDMNRLFNFSTIYIVAILIFAGFTAFSLAKWDKMNFLHWYSIGSGFVLLALFKGLHVHKLFWIISKHYNFGFTFWILLFALVVMGLFYLFLPFVYRLPKDILTKFVVGFTIWLTGAVVLDKIGGMYRAIYGHDMGYKLLYSIEEYFEIIGILIFALALVKLKNKDSVKV
jgi:hypothetical protein